MAGGSHPKSSKPPSSAAASSSSHRKSRWGSSTTSTTVNDNVPSDQKSIDPKPSKTKPSPKPGTTPSQSQPKPPTDPSPRSGPGSILPHGPSFPFPDPSALGPPPPPAYGFHMLERRTIALVDGSVRSYFALPHDYQDFGPLPHRSMDQAANRFYGSEFGGGPPRFPPPISPEGFRENREFWNGPDGSLKRKFPGDEEKDRRNEKEELIRQRQQLMQYANSNGFPMGIGPDRRSEFIPGTSSPFRRDLGDETRGAKYLRIGGGGYESAGVVLKHHEVDQTALKKAFLHFLKLVFESPAQRKKFLEDGRQGRVQCLACSRSSRDFPDMHGLIMHTYNSDMADLVVDHLGLHKALCVLMGWNYSKPPDNSKAYQILSAGEAVANQDDLVMWPPMVVVHNTITGKGKDGRMEGYGNKVMDSKIRDLGFVGGKSKSMYGREGHQGIAIVKYPGDQSGLIDALKLSEYFEKNGHGRKDWVRVQPSTLGKDDEKNPSLVKVDERTGDKLRILYGYLGTIADLDKLDYETRKKVSIESLREYKAAK